MAKKLKKETELYTDLSAKKPGELIMADGETLYDIIVEVTDFEILKEVVCPFFKKGKASKCVGCAQEEEEVIDCKTLMIDGVLKRPEFGTRTSIYSPVFDLPIVVKRETKALVDLTASLGLLCNTCHISDNCPLYAENHECGIDWKEDLDTTDPKKVIQHLIDIQTVRVTRARKMEEIDGGMPDQTTSTEMDRLSGLVATKDNMDADRFSLRVDATAKSGSEGGGILAKLFGGGGGSTTEALPEAQQTHTIDFEELELKPATADKRKKDV